MFNLFNQFVSTLYGLIQLIDQAFIDTVTLATPFFVQCLSKG